MKLGVASIQRFEDDHFIEWFSYYLFHGVDKFILRNHSMPGDPPSKSREWIIKLKQFYDIDHKDVTGYSGLYPNEFQNIMDGPRNDVDWLIWADGDEFHMPIEKENIKEVLLRYDHLNISALGIYWVNYGSAGYIDEPELMTRDFNVRSKLDTWINHHMKPIIKGKHAGDVYVTNPHVYTTEFGTIDLLGREIPSHCGFNAPAGQHGPISMGYGCPGIPCHEIMRINHYYNKSWNWFHNVKRKRGPGDRPPEADGGTIPASWWDVTEFKDEVDNIMWDNFGEGIMETINTVKMQIGMD